MNDQEDQIYLQEYDLRERKGLSVEPQGRYQPPV